MHRAAVPKIMLVLVEIFRDFLIYQKRGCHIVDDVYTRFRSIFIRHFKELQQLTQDWLGKQTLVFALTSSAKLLFKTLSSVLLATNPCREIEFKISLSILVRIYYQNITIIYYVIRNVVLKGQAVKRF